VSKKGIAHSSKLKRKKLAQAAIFVVSTYKHIEHAGLHFLLESASSF
jgi:hypothetical protein